MHPNAFIANWKNSDLPEQAAAQPWFIDLCAVLGVESPTDADTTGKLYQFEKHVQKAGGGGGRADVWKKAHFAWEFKGKNADLNKAYLQLLAYAGDLENPPLLVVSSFDRITVRSHFTNAAQVVETFTLDDLLDEEKRARLRSIWLDPEAWRRDQKGADPTTELAARELGAIALALRERQVDPHRAAHFTVELLFCYFAEDIGLLPKGLFTKLLSFGAKNPTAFAGELQRLLEAMRDGTHFNMESILRFNGGLLSEIVVEPLTAVEISRLAEIAALDWGAVEPAIFGTLFERSLDPARRSQLGAHYTGIADIERVVEPVVMQPLLRRWEEVRSAADQHFGAALGSDNKAAKARDAIGTIIDPFLAELRSLKILDPACGSGNFLYVALRKVMDLEAEVLLWKARAGFPYGMAEVKPEQLLGLEINEYAVEITRTVIWIGYLQWRIQHGYGPGDPVLGPLESIRLQDALLDLSGPEHPKETAWPAADFIIGNPPFLGNYRLRSELGDEYVDSLYTLFADRIPNGSDLCCYFFEKARAQIESGYSERGGLLATNSIRGGQNRQVLQRIKESGGIFAAWSDEPWILDGAAVRISIVGFDNGSWPTKELNNRRVDEINSDLTSFVDITTAQILSENRGLVHKGVETGGPFEIPNELAQNWINAPINPNQRPNSDVLKPVINAMDVSRRSRGVWMIDFGTEFSESEASLYELPFEYALRIIRPIRITNRDEKYARSWWRHRRPVPALRKSLHDMRRAIVTPGVAKFRLFVWCYPPTIPGNANFAFAREDDYFFGVLHSRAHEVWSLRMGTWLGKGNDPRYTPTTCFETYPFPWPPGKEPLDDPCVQAIAAAAKALDDTRRAWLDPPDATEDELKKRTLTNLYNAKPTWLQHLHATLDRRVWAAYGWPGDEVPADVPEEVILERLLAMNLDRASGKELLGPL